MFRLNSLKQFQFVLKTVNLISQYIEYQIQMSYFRKMLQEMQYQDSKKQTSENKANRQAQHNQMTLNTSKHFKKSQFIRKSSILLETEIEQMPKQRIDIQKPKRFPQKKLISSLLPSKVRMLRQIQSKKNKFSQIKTEALRIKQTNLNNKYLKSSRLNDQALIKQWNEVRKMCPNSAVKDAPLSEMNYVSERKTQRQQIDFDNLKQQLENQIMRKIMKLLQSQKDQRKEQVQIEQFGKKCQQNIVKDKVHPRINPSSQKVQGTFIETPLNSTSKSHQFQSAYPQHHPIIINNIVRETPTDKIDKSLIQREIKIKLLEQQRRNKEMDQSRYYRSMRPSIYEDKLLHQNSQNRHRRDYSDLVNINTVSPVNSFFQAAESMSSNKIKTEIQNKQYSNINSRDKQKGQLRIVQNFLDNGCQNDNPATSKFFQPNQCFSNKQDKTNEAINQLKVNVVSQKPSQKENNQIKQVQQSQYTRQERRNKRQQNLNNENSQKNQFVSAKRQIDLPKKPVLIQIPFDQNIVTVQTFSLAEAFKKRLGGLSSDKVREERSKLKSQRKKIQSNNHFLLSEYNQKIQKRKEEIAFSKNKLAKKPKIKQSLDVSALEKRKKRNSQNDKQLGKISRQPSQQLMQRLIHGSRAKISKKQMHALTRKNYEKLPQVRKKKQQQLKKMQEAERLSKIRAYQKQLRSASSSAVSII